MFRYERLTNETSWDSQRKDIYRVYTSLVNGIFLFFLKVFYSFIVFHIGLVINYPVQCSDTKD
jgi:hypothetical protein